MHDRQAGRTYRVSVPSGGGQANGNSSDPVVSDQPSIAYESGASNLVSGDSNAALDVFRVSP